MAGLIAASLLTGWDIGSLLIGLGCGLGAYLGAAWGNKEATKTDAYRQDLLKKRMQRTIPPVNPAGDETPPKP